MSHRRTGWIAADGHLRALSTGSEDFPSASIVSSSAHPFHLVEAICLHCPPTCAWSALASSSSQRLAATLSSTVTAARSTRAWAQATGEGLAEAGNDGYPAATGGAAAGNITNWEYQGHKVVLCNCPNGAVLDHEHLLAACSHSLLSPAAGGDDSS